MASRTHEPEPLLTPAEVASMFRVDPKTVTRWAKAGKLSAIRTLGGHRRGKRYGRLDCPAARRAIATGGYVRHRVFFADEATARAAGYRPCAACLPQRYRAWLREQRTGG